VGVQTASKRWNHAGCSLMWAFTGMKFWSIKSAVFWFSYDSASSRAQAPHAGTALKSSRMGRFSFLAVTSA